MQFLSDVQIPCETCRGRRFNAATLEIFFNGKTIFDVLEMTVDEAADFFAAQPKIHIILETLQQVGMGYVKLGQPSTTLSGGEAQRIKLAAELRKKSTGKTLYLLDEPTTGLHFHDIRLLLNCLNRLVEQGNTVLVIEHNLDVLKMADHILELGPGGGANGGELVCSGPPEKLAEEKTLTGRFLKKTLQGEPPVSYQIPTESDSDFVSEAPLKTKKRRKKISSKTPTSKINGRDIQIRGFEK